MSLYFRGDLIPGTHGQIIAGMPEYHSRREHFFGTRGNVEIRGGSGMRQLAVQIWIFNEFDSYTKCDDYIRSFDALVGTHAELTSKNSNNQVDQEFLNCTFEGIELVALSGQQEPGILQDLAGTVETPAGYWFAPSVLKFTQIAIA